MGNGSTVLPSPQVTELNNVIEQKLNNAQRNSQLDAEATAIFRGFRDAVMGNRNIPPETAARHLKLLDTAIGQAIRIEAVVRNTSDRSITERYEGLMTGLEEHIASLNKAQNGQDAERILSGIAGPSFRRFSSIFSDVENRNYGAFLIAGKEGSEVGLEITQSVLKHLRALPEEKRRDEAKRIITEMAEQLPPADKSTVQGDMEKLTEQLLKALE